MWLKTYLSHVEPNSLLFGRRTTRSTMEKLTLPNSTRCYMIPLNCWLQGNMLQSSFYLRSTVLNFKKEPKRVLLLWMNCQDLRQIKPHEIKATSQINNITKNFWKINI